MDRIKPHQTMSVTNEANSWN